MGNPKVSLCRRCVLPAVSLPCGRAVTLGADPSNHGLITVNKGGHMKLGSHEVEY